MKCLNPVSSAVDTHTLSIVAINDKYLYTASSVLYLMNIVNFGVFFIFGMGDLH